MPCRVGAGKPDSEGRMGWKGLGKVPPASPCTLPSHRLCPQLRCLHGPSVEGGGKGATQVRAGALCGNRDEGKQIRIGATSHPPLSLASLHTHDTGCQAENVPAEDDLRVPRTPDTGREKGTGHPALKSTETRFTRSTARQHFSRLPYRMNGQMKGDRHLKKLSSTQESQRLTQNESTEGTV